jgi:hypothetical protein
MLTPITKEYNSPCQPMISSIQTLSRQLSTPFVNTNVFNGGANDLDNNNIHTQYQLLE